MKCHVLLVCCLILINVTKNAHSTEIYKKPSVLIGILVRNKAHTLPYTLSFLEKLDYPKDRIALWIQSDNNVDNTINVLKTWLREQGDHYFLINATLDDKTHGIEDEKGIADWSPVRFEHVIKLREEVLNYARKIWADFIFMLDADVFLTNPNTLDSLISKNKTVVAPLLKSEGMYSNFWAGMTDDYYYKRTDEYEPILFKKTISCFPVPMVHSAILIDLRMKVSDLLTYDSNNLYNYDGPRDDIIAFALGAKNFDVDLHICNDENYGFITVPLESNDSIEHDHQQVVNIKLEMLDDQRSIPISKSMRRFVKYPKKDTLGVDNVYMINLLRRPERRQRMQSCFEELGVNAEIIDAVDGRTLNDSLLNSWGVKTMPGYKDPYHDRSMTMGEVGCFLSHYIVWNRIVEDGHKQAIVLEDDVKFEPYFRQKIRFLLQELDEHKKDWDLVYLGRKRMQKESEEWVGKSRYLVHAGYSYWTVGYLISAKGAKKLINARPLENLLPVDEYLPVMSDVHPRDDWKQHFEDRKMIILSVEPLVVFPTHYTGDSGYISDTENSILHSLPKESHGREEL
ncbi:glycosyltransferase 25 family member isoform X2 [Copidosoma floridanum]|uniref:glycosyltransferase 25 family member isoform X2 n=1 Tax=Copidosoma floridanum TaxID=29053 RepID=UPI000C6F6479|nr:glycosyltransferase 25 family member isoform X2 [Copidosoma floridanum]